MGMHSRIAREAGTAQKARLRRGSLTEYSVITQFTQGSGDSIVLWAKHKSSHAFALAGSVRRR